VTAHTEHWCLELAIWISMLDLVSVCSSHAHLEHDATCNSPRSVAIVCRSDCGTSVHWHKHSRCLQCLIAWSWLWITAKRARREQNAVVAIVHIQIHRTSCKFQFVTALPVFWALRDRFWHHLISHDPISHVRKMLHIWPSCTFFYRNGCSSRSG